MEPLPDTPDSPHAYAPAAIQFFDSTDEASATAAVSTQVSGTRKQISPLRSRNFAVNAHGCTASSHSEIAMAPRR
jgi:3-deoxy-D-manno-octulosonic acid (KDO) 8-phosphate synthase